MFINPKTAIKERWVTFPKWMTDDQQQQCIQPNALDFTIDKLMSIDSASTAHVGLTKKVMRKQVEILPTSQQWMITPASYDFMSDFHVNLPRGVAVMIVARSTFVRNGMFITTGLFDSGFKGPVGGILHNVIGTAVIDQHVRIGQVVFVESDSAGLYTGQYNSNPGEHWTAPQITKE